MFWYNGYEKLSYRIVCVQWAWIYFCYVTWQKSKLLEVHCSRMHGVTHIGFRRNQLYNHTWTYTQERKSVYISIITRINHASGLTAYLVSKKSFTLFSASYVRKPVQLYSLTFFLKHEHNFLFYSYFIYKSFEYSMLGIKLRKKCIF